MRAQRSAQGACLCGWGRLRSYSHRGVDFRGAKRAVEVGLHVRGKLVPGVMVFGALLEDDGTTLRSLRRTDDHGDTCPTPVGWPDVDSVSRAGATFCRPTPS